MNKKNKIKIKVNGKYLIISQKTTIHDLINTTNFSIDKIAIELNKKIIDKKKVKKTILNNKDVIEIVHFIGGG